MITLKSQVQMCGIITHTPFGVQIWLVFNYVLPASFFSFLAKKENPDCVHSFS